MQKALDSLLQVYLQKETTGGLLGDSRDLGLAVVDGRNSMEEDEFLIALHNCLEEKGVMKEVQAFLRQKLVNILKGVWPKLVNNKCEGDLGRVAMFLIEDYICCHRLLFTYSVLATEVHEGFTFKGNFGKMTIAKAETVLADMGIKKESKLSCKILESYSEEENWSLLECLINSSGWINPAHENQVNANELKLQKENEKLKEINKKYNNKNLDTQNNNMSIEEKLRILSETMEIDKEAQIEMRMDKFRNEETLKIRDEIETRLKFEILQKEKELLKNFENQVTHLKRNLKREKQCWALEKCQKEKELVETRNELVKALAIAKTLEYSNIHEQQNTPDVQEKVDKDVEPITKRDEKGEIRSTEKPTDLLNVIILKKDLERQFLFKEASLRSSIDKLKAENDFLRYKSAVVVSEPQFPPIITSGHTQVFPTQESQSNEFVFREKYLPLQPPSNPFADTIALMQYKIESQSEQIEKLQNINLEPKLFHELREIPITTENSPRSPTDLEKFLEESKRRFSQIENEAKAVELSVGVVKGRISNPLKRVVIPRPQIPQMPLIPMPDLMEEDSAPSKGFEYFPKHLHPDFPKPPPIPAYKPVLGTQPQQFGLSIFGNDLNLHSEILAKKHAEMANKTNAKASMIKEFEEFIRKDYSSPQILQEVGTGTTRRSEIKSNANEANLIDMRDEKSTIQIKNTQKELALTPTPINIEKETENKATTKISHMHPRIPEQNFFINANDYKSRESSPVRVQHQEIASTSGALVKDKLSTSEKSDLEADASFNNSSTSSVIEINKSIQLKPTWGEILKTPRGNETPSHNKIFPDTSENIDEIGHIDGKDEDFWTL